jgi:ABC-type phosphate transport system substrate-binding protein
MGARGSIARAAVAAAVAAMAVAPVSIGRAERDDYKLIVHPENEHTKLERTFVRDAYLKKAKTWSDGTTIRPIDLPNDVAARARFTREVIRKTPAQLRSYWNQRVYSGKGVPPPVVDGVAAAIAYVLATPGAIAYIPSGAYPEGARVVTLE